MVSTIEQQKSAMRAMIRSEVQWLSPTDRARSSEQLGVRLTQQEAWKRAHAISFYAPMFDEPDIWPLISQALASGRVVALPRYSKATQSYVVRQVLDLQTDIGIGYFGIREPLEACEEVPLNRLDLVLVPGVGFDSRGQRLGRGRGFYDRLLAGVSGAKCGIAFDEQIVAEVPAGPHDVRVNCILTPTRWIET